MRIKSFSTNNFAGLAQRSYSFEEGINILYGPNEAGKTTVIDAIYHALFTPAKLKKNLKADKDFIDKYFSDKSDTIDASVSFQVGKDEYRIKRIWSKEGQPSERLTLADGSSLTSEKAIKDKLQELFHFGPATYKYLNFASHGDLEDALKGLSSNEFVQGDIRSYLNQSVMELDGISLRDLEDNIQTRMKVLGEKWDFDKNRPQNNRGIDDPYARGLGKILEAYYAKENLKRDIQEAYAREEAFDQAGDQLAKTEASYGRIKEKKVGLDAVSEDIRKRADLERDLRDADEDLARLKQANMDFPQFKLDYETGLAALAASQAQKKDLEANLDYAAKFQERTRLQGQVQAYQKIQDQIKGIDQDLEAYKEIDRTLLARAQNLDSAIGSLKAQLGSDSLSINITRLKDDVDIQMTDGLGQDLAQDQATGSYFQIRIGDLAQIQVSPADLDYDQVSQDLKAKEKDLKAILERAGVKDVQELGQALQRKQDLEEKRGSLDLQAQASLQGQPYDQVLASYQDLKAYTKDYDVEQIKEDMASLQVMIEGQEEARFQAQVKYQGLVDSYGSQEEIFNQLSQRVLEKNDLEGQLNQLASLPQAYETTEEFFTDKRAIDQEYESLTQARFQAQDLHNQALRALPDTSSEELRADLEDKEADFSRLIKNYQDLEAINKVFYQTYDLMQARPTAGLEASMDKYLDQITSGSIQVKGMDQGLALTSQTSQNLKYIHLSRGSRESVALALRLALIENIFPGPTFIAFDDVLTDLDEERTQEAARLLKSFAQTNQIIYASCLVQTKDLLSGHIIEVGG